MTVRDMIRELIMYPMDYQVVDTDGSPIMYMLFHDPHSKKVRLEPKAQIDVDSWLEDYFNECMETAPTDIDAVTELLDAGFDLDDVRDYSEDSYEWMKRVIEENEIEI